MSKSISLIESQGRWLLSFNEWPSEKDYERIKMRLKDEFHAMEIIETIGPGMIIWEFFIGNCHLKLINDDYGNFILANDQRQLEAIRMINELWDLFT